MSKKTKKTIKKWKEYSKISDIGSITRRYFVMNAFDGALTMLGIYLTKISDESMIRHGLQMLVVGIVTAGLCILTSVLLGGEALV